jgi:hypothetical protein
VLTARSAVRWLVLVAAVVSVSYGMARDRRGSSGGYIPAFRSVTYGQWAVYGNGACPATKCIGADTWYSVWADDGNIYLSGDDTNGGWNNVGISANVFFSKIDGYTSAATATIVNSMSAWGPFNTTGSDNATYKASGAIAVHGYTYLMVYRQNKSAPPNSLSAQLLKSGLHDYGATFTPVPPATQQPYASPMFTNVKFTVPQFIQYPNADYTGQTVDRSDQFVYAMSPDSTGSTGPSDVLYLARVPVAAIGNQNIADWQFYQGGDGALDANWGALSTMVPTINEPGCGCHSNTETMVYLPYWQKYILIDFHYAPPGNDAGKSIFDVYQFDHPWGPWVHRQSDNFFTPGSAQTLNASGFYFMGTVVKSVAPDGGRTFTMLASGNYTTAATYTMYMIPVTVNP